MSAIGTIFKRDLSPVSSSETQRMTNALRLHGPIAQAGKAFGNFGLSWAQSGIFTPEDRFDRQPVGVGGRWSLVFDGFLTERDELVATLGLDAKYARTLPDSHLVHAAWQKWQTDTPARLRGEFAIILCDTEAQLLYAARSPVAALPIFYHETKTRLTLASAPKGIFALGDVPREIDEHRLADSMILNYQDAGRSYYKGIKPLRLGHMLVASSEKLSFRRFYDLRDASDIRFARDDDYVEAAKELFGRATACHMRAEKTPAAALSSGLDSSSIVVAALDHLKEADTGNAERLVSFTSVPEDGWDGRIKGADRIGDESVPLRALLDMYPELDARFVDSEGLPIDYELDKIILLSEAPPGAIGNMHWIVDIHTLARQEGRSVLLTGVAGNFTLSFDGSDIYAKLLRRGRLAKLFRELRQLDNSGLRFLGLYGRAVAPNLPPAAARRFEKLIGHRASIGRENMSPVHPDYAGDLRVYERADQMGWDADQAGVAGRDDLIVKMAETGNRDSMQSVRAAVQALTGVRGRDPMSDRRLVEFCAGLPDEQFLKNGVRRRLIKRMMADRLPPAILNETHGKQAADRHLRMTRDLPKYRREIERMADDPDMSRRFDVPRLLKLLDSWPEKTPVNEADHPDFRMVLNGFGRAIATSRFINWVNGKN